MKNPFWLNRHPYHHRVFTVLADALDTLVALLTLGIVGSGFGMRAIFQVTSIQIKKKIK